MAGQACLNLIGSMMEQVQTFIECQMDLPTIPIICRLKGVRVGEVQNVAVDMHTGVGCFLLEECVCACVHACVCVCVCICISVFLLVWNSAWTFVFGVPVGLQFFCYFTLDKYCSPKADNLWQVFGAQCAGIQPLMRLHSALASFQNQGCKSASLGSPQ